MSVPPEVMQRLMAAQGGAGGGQAPGGAQASPQQTPGAGGNPQAAIGSPMGKPEPKKGLIAGAQANIRIAQNVLEQALTVLDHTSPEYKTVLDCLGRLSKIAGKNDSNDLVPAEVMRMVGQMPQMGGGTQMQRAIMQQLRQPQGQPPQGQPPQQPQGAMQ